MNEGGAHDGRRSGTHGERGVVVTLGEAMLRLTAPLGARLRHATQLRSFVAGAEANVARALAALGVPVRWVSALPDNALGDRVAGELAGAGVDTSFVQRVPGARLGLFFVEQARAPRGTRVSYDREDSAFARMEGFDAGALDGASWAVLSGITPAIGERSRRLADAFAAAALERGAALCIDVNHRRMLWDAERARSALAPLLARAELVICSERDAREVLELEGDGEALAEALFERWAPAAEAVALTRGAEGAVIAGREGTASSPGRPVEVLDRFGAGDAFCAALIWSLWRGDSHERALAAATALAELACTVPGDAAEFSAHELEQAIRETPTAIVR